MEKIWNWFSSRVESFFFERKMKRYRLGAGKVKEKVDAYLVEKGIKFQSKVVDDDELDWPKVRVQVILENDLKEIFKIWDKLCEVGYHGISREDMHGIFICCEFNDDVAWRDDVCHSVLVDGDVP